MKLYKLPLLLFLLVGIQIQAQSWDGYLFRLQPTNDVEDITHYFKQLNQEVVIESIAPSIDLFVLHNKTLEIRKKDSSFFEKMIDNCAGIHQWQRNYYLSHRRITTNDPKFNEQWYLEKINVPNAWEITTGLVTPSSPQPSIGVIEAGVTFNQPEFEDIFFINSQEIPNNGQDDDNNGYIDDVSGWNFNINSPQHAIDDTYHGDAVIGVMAAKSNNNKGIAGINWSPKIVLTSLEDRATNSKTIQAYEYLYQARKRFNETNGQEGSFIVVSNSSFGEDGLFEEDVPFFCEMYNKMGSVGILSVGATTNSETNVDNFGDIPSDCSSSELIIATSIDETEDIKGGFGKINVDIAAPGTDILTVNKEDEILDDAGTSFSTPQVSAIISLAYSLPLDSLHKAAMNNPLATAAEIKDCVLSTVQPSIQLASRSSSGGILDAAACLECVVEKYKIDTEPLQLKITNVYPNIANEFIKFTYTANSSQDKISYSIIDVSGKILSSDELESHITDYYQIDINGLPAGVYFLRLEQDKSRSSWKFVKM